MKNSGEFQQYSDIDSLSKIELLVDQLYVLYFEKIPASTASKNFEILFDFELSAVDTPLMIEKLRGVLDIYLAVPMKSDMQIVLLRMLNHQIDVFSSGSGSKHNVREKAALAFAQLRISDLGQLTQRIRRIASNRVELRNFLANIVFDKKLDESFIEYSMDVNEILNVFESVIRYDSNLPENDVAEFLELVELLKFIKINIARPSSLTDFDIKSYGQAQDIFDFSTLLADLDHIGDKVQLYAAFKKVQKLRESLVRVFGNDLSLLPGRISLMHRLAVFESIIKDLEDAKRDADDIWWTLVITGDKKWSVFGLLKLQELTPTMFHFWSLKEYLSRAKNSLDREFYSLVKIKLVELHDTYLKQLN